MGVFLPAAEPKVDPPNVGGLGQGQGLACEVDVLM